MTGIVTAFDTRRRATTTVAGALTDVPGILVFTFGLVLAVPIHLKVGVVFLFRHAAYFFAEISFRWAPTSVA